MRIKGAAMQDFSRGAKHARQGDRVRAGWTLTKGHAKHGGQKVGGRLGRGRSLRADGMKNHVRVGDRRFAVRALPNGEQQKVAVRFAMTP